MYPTVPLPSLDESSPLNRFLFYSPSRKNIMSVFILLCFVLCVAEVGVGLNFLRRALFLLMYSPNEKWIVTCKFTCKGIRAISILSENGCFEEIRIFYSFT